MILTIAQYMEALSSTDGRLKTLDRVYLRHGDDGEPVFSIPGHGLVDFEIMAGGRRHTLRCPLRFDEGAAAVLRTLGERDAGLDSRFFTPWKLLPGEIVLFDGAGKPFEVDILVRPTPEGEPFADFLAGAITRGDIASVRAALLSFEELAGWARTISRGGITARRLLVSPGGELTLTRFSATDETSAIRDELMAAADGETVAGTTGGTRAGTGYALDGEGAVRCVRDGGGWMYVDSRGRAVIDAVWSAATPFRGGRAEVETPRGKGLIDIRGRAVLEPVYEEVVWDDFWDLAAVMVEGCWWLVDREGKALTTETYDWIGECSEGLLLAQKWGKCGFIDTRGREAIEFLYDDASSFSEGISLVRLAGAGGSSEIFFIDPHGRRL
jgi:hypothetical protein